MTATAPPASRQAVLTSPPVGSGGTDALLTPYLPLSDFSNAACSGFGASSTILPLARESAGTSTSAAKKSVRMSDAPIGSEVRQVLVEALELLAAERVSGRHLRVADAGAAADL